jgi:hypothetical protein
MAKVKLENQAQKERMFQLYDTFSNLNVVPFIKSDMDLRWFKLVNSIVSSTIEKEFEDPYAKTGIEHYTKMFFQYYPTKVEGSTQTSKGWDDGLERVVKEYTLYKASK